MSTQEALFSEANSLLPSDAEQASGEHGEVFTRPWVVELILDLCGYTADRDLAALTAVEPSCGSGAFLGPMLRRLLESAEAHNRTDHLGEAEPLRAFDLLEANVTRSRSLVSSALERGGLDPDRARECANAWVARRDFLLTPPGDASADFVIGNPPYIRLEAIPRARSDAYRRACPTMGGRADVYVGFFEKGLRALRTSGTLGFICADRWMRNAYGARLRAMISSGWSVDAVISMTGVDAFEEEVDAYPAITVLRRTAQNAGPVVVDTAETFGEEQARDLSKRASLGPGQTLHRPTYSAARLNAWFTGKGGWPHGSPDELAAIASLEARLRPLEDPGTGTRVGIGVATGADNVFVVNGDCSAEPERLLPLAMSRDIATGELRWSGKRLLNPWEASGLVDLGTWPLFAAILKGHRLQLGSRHTARRGDWYRTIDRVIPGLLERPKLYIPDFKDVLFPVLDEGATYPHHNLYWISSDTWDLKVLGGLLLSAVPNMFIRAYSVRMRGGYLRFQAQYLRRIRVPPVPTGRVAEELRQAFAERDHARATAASLPLYGLDEHPA